MLVGLGRLVDAGGEFGREGDLRDWVSERISSVCWCRGLLLRTVLLSGTMEMAFSFTNPSCLRLCLLTRLKGSRENCTPPLVLRLTR